MLNFVSMHVGELCIVMSQNDSFFFLLAHKCARKQPCMTHLSKAHANPGLVV